jgi:Penicillin V acylase and related amidases
VVDGYPSYFDCYNEDGLGIAGLNFPHFAKFSDGPIDGKINLASYEIMLWVTQNFTHVSEVKEALKNVNLVMKLLTHHLRLPLFTGSLVIVTKPLLLKFQSNME